MNDTPTTTPETTMTEPSPWNLPNALTVLRILLVPVFVWLVLSDAGQDTTMRWWAWGVVAVAIITDRIDGDLARAKGLVTNFGKVADPIADKALTGAGFITLAMIDLIPWWITIVILARELAITLLRFWVIRHGVMPASRGGKIKTVLQALAIALYVMPFHTFPLELLWRGLAGFVLLAALLVTIVTGVDYVVKALTLRATSDRARMKRERKQSGDH